MRGLTPAAMAIVAACYQPQPQAGAPCVTDAECPSPLVCSPRMTCELDRAGPAVDGGNTLRPDGCVPSAEICGNGIDEDCDDADLPCAANDHAGGAIDVTAGGTFTGDARLATDDVLANGCSGNGGRDLFFRVAPTAPEVYYFDTFGSSYDTVIRIYRRSCAEVGTGPGATACADDACGGGQSQVALSLPAGESCIVVDQRDAAEPTGDLTLHVVRGGRDGLPLDRGAHTYAGDTCTATNASEPLNQNCDGPGAGGKDHALFFTTCPGETLRLDANTCPAPSWDTVLYVKRVNGDQIGCNDDTCGWGSQLTSVTISNSSLYFLFLDGFDPSQCGPYQLDTNLRP